MTRPHYVEATCKSALNRVTGMPFAWSLNPYRGCVHGCHYCYARATHAYLGLNAGEDFSTRIFVKTNLAEVLRRELRRPSWQRERVALGTATDPYQPCDGRYRITRAALVALLDAATPVSIVTKSTLVVRDLDVLRDLAGFPGTRVNFTITTLDPALSRLVEPGTPPPAQRLRAMRRLADAGVPCGVYVAPVLPHVTDGEGALEALANAARQHGATSFWGGPLRLAPLVKEHYLSFIAASYPALRPAYERNFPHADAPRGYRDALERRLEHVRHDFGFSGDDRKAIAVPASSPRTGECAVQQLTMPLLA